MAAKPSEVWESNAYRLDAQNRIYVPEEVRAALGVQRGESLAYRVKDGKVSLHGVIVRIKD
jgi:bifunctional DNA-binding transcriptional regulator/antitoxin component of YhaV-PrlF toxin-antitoxin module